MNVAQRTALALGLIVSAFYIYTASPSVSVGDSGEFIAACATLSLPHAPSYPLFTLLGKCAVVLNPFGSLAYRVNLLSALLGSVTVVLIFLICLRMGLSALSGACAALTLAFSNVLWEPSLTAEVFTLNSAFAAAILLVFVSGRIPLSTRVCLGAFLFGLGLGNHHTLVFVLTAVFFLYLKELRDRNISAAEMINMLAKDLAVSTIFFSLGFSVYLFLPVRSLRNPALDWSNPENLENFMRVLLRKDYGSFSLTLGEKMTRNMAAMIRQTDRYVSFLVRDISLAGALAAGAGWLAWLKKDFFRAGAMLAFFVVSGVGFLLLGNLPFDSQSTGVLTRFYLMPALPLALALAHWIEWLCRPARIFAGRGLAKLQTAVGAAASLGIPLFLLCNAHGHRTFSRTDYAAHDYGRNLLKTLPLNAALFMDGGDDTFYTLAYFTLAEKQRPDLRVHDRGGLIFPNPYGDDFRRIPKEEKSARRQSVEESFLGKRPLYYSSFDPKVLQGAVLAPRGVLYEALPEQRALLNPEKNRALWKCYSLRGVYEPVADYPYRLRALVPLYPFMQGTSDWNLGLLKRAAGFGTDIMWLQSNLVISLSLNAYELVQNSRLDEAADLYRFAARVDPKFVSAYTNLGVIAERNGNFDGAETFYRKAVEVDPGYAETYYNLGVLYWKQARWEEVVRMFERTLQLNPNHAGAYRFLMSARRKLSASVKK